MNTLVLYSNHSGNGKILKVISYITDQLKQSFDDVASMEVSSADELSFAIKNSEGKYDSIIVCGGDGSLNLAVNEIMKLEDKPVVGFLNFGTLGDVGKNFGISKNLNSSLKILCSRNIQKIDLGKVGERYFVYMASNGAFSKIASKRKHKKSFLTYYLDSISEALSHHLHHYIISSNGIKKPCKSSFILFMNGKYVGGFKINNQSEIDDGKLEMFVPKETFLNGIPSFFLNRKSIEIVKLSEAKIECDDSFWCLDGEIFNIQNPLISIEKQCISFFVK